MPIAPAVLTCPPLACHYAPRLLLLCGPHIADCAGCADLPPPPSTPRWPAFTHTNQNSCAKHALPTKHQHQPHLTRQPGERATKGKKGTPTHVPPHPHRLERQGDAIDHAHRPGKMHMPLAKKHAPGTMAGAPEENKTSFFGQVQTHGEQSAPPALVATSIPSANAQPANCGMEQWQEPKRMDMGGWSARTALQSATTGSYPPVASPQATTSGTSAQAAERQATEPKTVLERRRNETVSPYKHSMWAAELTRLGLYPKYPTVVDGLRDGFDLGIPYIFSTYVPPNNPSVTHLPDVYNSTINNEFAAGRYIGPFSRTEMEAEVGPFQTSPLSFIPKASKPDKYRAIHNFSFPHKPSPKATSINSHINSEDFPCTWGTFATITQLIAHLPPGSQASVRDVAEAYRTIPANPSQWPGLVIRLQNEDQYAVNVCNNFGLTSAGGVYGMVADAGTDIFRGNGIGPLAKWVDDHVFF